MNNELTKTIQDIISSLSKEYFFDYYQINYISVSGIDLSEKKKNLYIINTIDVYNTFHKTERGKLPLKITKYFLNLVVYDKPIYFNEKIIYKELYKILYLIDSTLKIQKLLNNKNEYPKGFANKQISLKKINALRIRDKKNIIGDDKLFNRTESKIRYWLCTMYVKNKNLTKFFLYLFLISDVEKLKIYQNENDENINTITNIYSWFILQQTTIPKIVKSLGILLYFEQIKFLKIKKDQAEVNTKAIIFELFNEPLNAYEFHKHIHISSSVYFPIFSASKNDYFNDEEKQFIKKQVLVELQSYIEIDNTIFENLFDIFLKSSHIQFLQKYPVELFCKNPKYSS